MEHGLSRLPICNDLDPMDLPWDIAQLYSTRRYLDYVDYEMAMQKDRVPMPTPRTKASPAGFAMWVKWAEAEEERMHRENEESVFDNKSIPYMSGYELYWDHIIFDRERGTIHSEIDGLCLYCTDRKDEWYLDIIYVNDAYKVKRGNKVVYSQKESGRKASDVKPVDVFGISRSV